MTAEEIKLFESAQEALETVEKAAVAELAHELAHQLNNPLEALVNLIYLCRQKASDDELKSILDEADSQLARISAVVNTIVTLKKVDPDQRVSAGLKGIQYGRLEGGPCGRQMVPRHTAAQTA